MQNVSNDMEMDFMILHKWFQENQMVLNCGKCHCIVIGDDYSSLTFNLNEITNSSEEKLFGIVLDSKLNFLVLASFRKK